VREGAWIPQNEKRRIVLISGPVIEGIVYAQVADVGSRPYRDELKRESGW